jgi:hypothetical protein
LRLVLVALAAVLAIAATTAATATSAAAAAAATTTAATTTTVPTTTTAAATFAAATIAAAGARSTARAAIESGHVLSLWTLLSLANLELDLLTFLQLAEATALDRGEVHEAIFSAVVRRDETIPLLCIEPLDYPCRAHRALSLASGVLEAA